MGEIRAAEERKVPAVAEKAGEGSSKGMEIRIPKYNDAWMDNGVERSAIE